MKKGFGHLAAALAATAPFFGYSAAQSGTPVVYTDPTTGIIFDTWPVSSAQTAGGMTFGVALPSNALTVDATEFIGILTCSSQSTSATGWCGLSLGGPMTNSLLLTAWPNNGEVLTSFRWATSYSAPVIYEGPAKLTQISSTINATHYSVIFRCQECLTWSQGGVSGKASTSAGNLVLGWAQAFPTPSNPTCPAQAVVVQHDNGMGIFGAQLDSNAANPSYTAWAAKATKTVTGTCGTTTTTTISSVPVPTGTSYDYIVVGAGAGGIPLADRLSSTGKSVLLIEKGPPSSGRYGGKMRPNWLQDTNLTRFDVPGLCNQIWVDSAGIACTDTDQMAGCVLGGGTAVNAGLWWRPYSLDWDYNFPNGWKATDMAAATSRVFGRIPGTDVPSSDGKLYLQEGFEAISGGLKAGGWSQVQANNVPNSKNRTYAHTPYMFSGGERGGPMATYLVSSLARKNFKLWVNTTVKRVVRTDGHATGLEVEAFGNGGYAGTVPLTSITGRVVLSAGTFGSAKLLLRSGIGPKDQLEVVKASRQDGSTMINSAQWINLPVGYNLEDHTNTDTVVSHPGVVFYDFYEAWSTPNPADKDAYLKRRAGILTQAAPNIGPVFWEEIKGADGRVRQLQWTARVEGSMGAPNGKAITMSQYLGRGATSRGRMTITPDLVTQVSTNPFLRDPHDKAAVIQGIKNLQAALKNVKGLEWNFPNSSISVEDYVNSIPATYGFRRANHWIGTAKLGTDDGRNGGSAVVDLNTKVWGTDNIHVVDASIFPGMVTTNPSAYVVIASERASERILALPDVKAVPRYQQCGGQNFNGPFICAAPYTCQMQNPYYSQCL